MMFQNEKSQAYWRKTLGLSAGLTLFWLFVTFVLTYFANTLTFKIFGWPFSFWMASQGSLVVFCLIIWFYAWRMGKLDAEYGLLDERD